MSESVLTSFAVGSCVLGHLAKTNLA